MDDPTPPNPPAITSETDLAAAAGQLGAADVPGLCRDEELLLEKARGHELRPHQLAHYREAIEAGGDPLGDLFCALRTPADRRPLGATYTPAAIVDAMIAWAAAEDTPARVIDPGAGSGRFSVAAGRAFPHAQLIAVEIDPLAALVTRANLAAAGLAKRARVERVDYRELKPERIDGRTLYCSNPPYVRHHQISQGWKGWFGIAAGRRGLNASKLAGLHVHFYLATADMADKGDYGTFITASEWLDVNYGSAVRELLLDGLGGLAVHVLDAKALPFADAATTGAISCFRVGARPTSLRLRKVEKAADLGALEGGRLVKRERLAEAPRWSVLMRAATKVPEGHVELGELCRVHRGTVTGANGVWVTSQGDERLPATAVRASVTRARELFTAGDRIATAAALRGVVDLPADLDVFDTDERRRVEAFLKWAKGQGADKGYIARHRKAWWSVGLRAPAPILATYMARKPPAFVRNLADARHINIAHGLYPRQPIPELALDRLATALRDTVSIHSGRTYAGGLVKFEPKEMERLAVPSLEVLLAP